MADASESSLEDRVGDLVQQFSRTGTQADIWRLLDIAVDTEAYLNMGYSSGLQPHVLGSPQRRLAMHLADSLEDRVGSLRGADVLDLGCGRGGPSVAIADRYGCSVLGVDLVPYNVELARGRATASDADAAFLIGMAERLPVRPGRIDACVAIDSLMYLTDLEAGLGEIGRVLGDGWGISSMLVGPESPPLDVRVTLDAFSDAWDMASIRPLSTVRQEYHTGSAAVRSVEDISSRSVRRFRRWTTLGVSLLNLPGRPVQRSLKRFGLDADAIEDQIRATHAALPHLRHVVIESQW